MKVFLYFIVYTVMIMGVFITMMYLMALIDPNLSDLPAKAAKMMKANLNGDTAASAAPGDAAAPGVPAAPRDGSVMAPENYVDFEEYMKKRKP